MNIRQVIKKIKLPIQKNININQIEYRKNPLEEYDDLIMKNLFIDEIKNRPDYIHLKNNYTEKDNINRFVAINFIISISETFEFKQETIYLAINLYDRCYDKFKICYKPVNIKIFVLSCIFIASKYEEIYPPLLEDYSEYFFFSKSEIFNLESFILDIINFELLICSPYLFLTKFFYSNTKEENKEILYLAQLILDLSIISLDFCRLKPSKQASICLYLSRYITYNNKNTSKLWTWEDEFTTGISELEIKTNIKPSIIKIKEFSDGRLTKDINKTGIFKKYYSHKYLSVAKRFRCYF